MTLAAHFETQAIACDALGSPFTARLLRLIINDLPDGAVKDRLTSWPLEDLKADAVALRLAGALHSVVLTGQNAELSASYPPHVETDAVLLSAMHKAFATNTAHILHWMDSAPQTNEPRRATALILGAMAAARAFPKMPLSVIELGASAGLNLHFDQFATDLNGQSFGAQDPVLTLSPDFKGTAPVDTSFTVKSRQGVDLNPLDPSNTDDLLRLRSYIWPDQNDRLDRLDRLAQLPPAPVDAGDAGAWLGTALDETRTGQITFLYHTIAWQYFPEATDAACRAAIEKAAARATEQAPLAWLSFEMDEKSPGAPVILRLWPENQTIPLGRMDFHGRWFDATLS